MKYIVILSENIYMLRSIENSKTLDKNVKPAWIIFEIKIIQ